VAAAIGPGSRTACLSASADNYMSNRWITVGMAGAFLALILLVLGVGDLGLRAMRRLHDDTRNIAESQWVDVQLAAQALRYSDRNVQINTEIFLSDDPSKVEFLLAERGENSAKISDLFARMQTRVDSADEQEHLNALLRARKDYTTSYHRATGTLLGGRKTEARSTLTAETLPLLVKYQSTFSDYADFQTAEMNEAVAKSAERYAEARRRADLLIGLSVLLAFAIAGFVVPEVGHEIRRRESAEGKLRDLNRDLEIKVAERTADLEQSNLKLSAEIAERKRNEDLVRRLSTAVEQCPVSVMITDLNGNITYINRRFLECTGYSYEEIIGQNPRFLKSGSTPPEAYRKLWRAITSGQEWRGEFRNRKKNGELYSEYAVIRPIRDEKGEIAHFLAIKEDTTQRREMEAHLQQAQRLEAIGQLAAGIAHEINTPMQFVGDNTRFLQKAWSSLNEVIAMLSSVAASSGDGPVLCQVVERLEALDLKFLKEEVPQAISQSLDGIDRVCKIVRAIKDFSHPGSDDKCLADINKAIETTITVARNEWKDFAEVETSLSPIVGSVPCYIAEINQVILNLLVNAAHAISRRAESGWNGQGKIVIRTTRDKDCAEIAIQDNGCGIPAAMQSRIFQPFFTTKEPGAGTGQGLALAYAAIVKKHSGNIWFETKEGEGTTFFIRLPMEWAATATGTVG